MTISFCASMKFFFVSVVPPSFIGGRPPKVSVGHAAWICVVIYDLHTELTSFPLVPGRLPSLLLKLTASSVL